MSTDQVASHYNDLNEDGLAKRSESRIFYQRNFNNWTKSVAIANALSDLRKNREKKSNNDITVLDLGAGKGGDLLKWKKGNIKHITCVDIACVSMEQCKSRYNDMIKRSQNDRYNSNYTAEFIVTDCTHKTFIEKCEQGKDQMFDITSCQFCLHYSFESQSQAETFLSNACFNLKPGGYFIGTTTNAYQMIKQLRQSGNMSFGNNIYNIEFHLDDKNNIPLFGAKYNFFLDGVVNCPEYLVYFPLLEKMLEKHNMKLVYSLSIGEFYEKYCTSAEHRNLLNRMKALETYPADEGSELINKEPNAYEYAKEFLKTKFKPNMRPMKLGTLSASEWEVSNLYLVFAFKKCS